MLKESEFLKNSKIRILLCVEIVLVLIGMIGLWGKNQVLVGMDQTDMLIQEGVSLPAGVYKLRLYYEAEGGSLGDFGVSVDDPMYKTLLMNNVPLYAGLTERECEFYLRDSVENLKAVADVSENVEIKGMELISTNKGSRIYLFWTILLSALLNGYLVLYLYHRKHPIPAEKQLPLWGIPAFALIASIPSLVDYNIIGEDLIFHMQRIEALTQAIVQGELSVRMESMWLGGHGYANSFFYGDTCLIVPALLRVLGMNMDSAYRLFLVITNLATAGIAYLSFAKCFKSRWIGFLGCGLYTLAPYRIYNMYNRAAVGEFLAMVFLPLLVWGFYRIYTDDTDRKGYFWNWVIPTIGFSGIIQSYALTCEMAGVFVILLCIVLWKKTFQKKTFLVLALTVVMTVVINGWYLVPFLDLMMSDKFYFGNNANVLIQSRGILPAQIFYTLQAGGKSSRFVENGMVDTEPIGLGAALLLCAGMWVVLRVRNRKTAISNEKRQEMVAGDVASVLLVVALFMSTCYFPWNYLSKAHRIFATLVGSLQFPTRITTIVTILGVVIACIMCKWLLSEWNGFKGKAALVGILFVAVLFGSYQVNDILYTRDEFIRLYTWQNVGSTAVLGAEYLPLDASIGHMTYHSPVLSEGVVMEDYKKDGLEITAYLQASQEGYIELPLLFYKGYHACATSSGEKLSVVKGDNCDVRVMLPQGFQGEIRVWYGGMWYWHVAEAVSVIVGVSLLAYCQGYKRIWVKHLNVR